MQVNLNDLYSIVEPNHYLKFVDRLSEISWQLYFKILLYV
jgi:hypothetical protein